MDDGRKHQMVITNTFATGEQEWYCPTCGRRFILQPPPNFKRIIIDEGDEQTPHSGGRGGVVVGNANIEPADPRDIDENQGTVDPDDPYLSPWKRWLDNQ
jgi:hypothetical protein